MEWYIYAIAIGGSIFAGVINTLAGNGSAITLTILTELIGLPPNIANGTNRLGVFSQGALGTFAFYKNGKLKLDRSRWIIVMTVIGAILGMIVATMVSNDQFKRVFRFLMILMLFVILVKPKRWLRETDTSNPTPIGVVIPVFLVLGFYGGFIQMGMGVFFLAAMVLGMRYSIMDGNVVKVFVVALYTIFAIILFQWQGMIEWKIGLIMAAGQAIGGYLGANFASKSERANIWAHRLLVFVVILAIIKLFNLHLLLL